MTTRLAALALACGFTLLCVSAAIGLSYAPSVAADVVAQAVCVQAATIDIKPGITALNVRRAPVTGEVITTLGTQTGLKVLAIDISTCWYKINTPKGEGWITNSATYVTVATTATPMTQPTRTPVATFTPVDTPYPLVVSSQGEPYVCKRGITPQPPMLLLPDNSWLACERVIIATPTRITP